MVYKFFDQKSATVRANKFASQAGKGIDSENQQLLKNYTSQFLEN